MRHIAQPCTCRLYPLPSEHSTAAAAGDDGQAPTAPGAWGAQARAAAEAPAGGRPVGLALSRAIPGQDGKQTTENLHEAEAAAAAGVQQPQVGLLGLLALRDGLVSESRQIGFVHTVHS
jgi:hypothetical protein